MRARAAFAAGVAKAARSAAIAVAHRTPGNIPGAIALKLDKTVLEDLAEGAETIAVTTGTNGKTTTNNLLADCLARTGRPLYCNRDGNNLESGVVTAYLAGTETYRPAAADAAGAVTGAGSVDAAGAGDAGSAGAVASAINDPAGAGSANSDAAAGAAGTADAPVAAGAADASDSAASVGGPIACFETDEMYTRFVVPRTKPRFFLILNLFRDQLDRFGELEHVQDVFVQALKGSPQTTLVYNADDPLCAIIVERVDNPSIAFGIASDLGLDADRVSDSRFCQKCGAELEYDYLHYGQLGAWKCPACGNRRPHLDVAATDVRLEEDGYTFEVDGRRMHTGLTGVYMIYNVLAAYTLATRSGMADFDTVQDCVHAYRPDNGRLQEFTVPDRSGTERHVMTNLAKNPTGFNQNVRIVVAEKGRVLALFVNDNDADGHDVSWFWDIDFERLTQLEGLKAYVGGTRANDMQVRLKYAGVAAEIVGSVSDVLERTGADDGKVYVIANYTALPAVRRELTGLESGDAR